MHTKIQSFALLVLAIMQPIAGRLGQWLHRGSSIEQRSDAARGAVTPAKGAFAIWGPLFAGNFTLAARSFYRPPAERLIDKWIGWLSAGASAGNTAWSLQAQFSGLGWPSVGIISATAASASAATVLAESVSDESGFTRHAANTMGPLAGWLTVAAFANVDATFTAKRAPESDARKSRRGCALVGAASVAATGMAIGTRGNLGYAAAAAWGLGGVFLRNRREARSEVAYTAAIGIGAVAAATLLARQWLRD